MITLGCDPKNESDSTSPVNVAPTEPINTNPQNGATNIPIDTYISWQCTELDGDSLFFDVYFGTDNNLPMVNEAQTEIFYYPDSLEYETTYYWKVVAYDQLENYSYSDIWCFTTEEIDINIVLLPVYAGEYSFGDPAQILTIDYYYEIMKYEVTNLQYFIYLNEALDEDEIVITDSGIEGYYEGDDIYAAGNYVFYDLNDNDCRISWDGTEFSIQPGYEQHPVCEVTWFGAWAFAEHFDMSLPTEHEWEKAARGLTTSNFPWANSFDGRRANTFNSGDPYDNGTTPVGMYNGQTVQYCHTLDTPSPYGLYDVIGNVREWTDSWLEPDSEYRICRGGGWYDPYLYTYVWKRITSLPASSRNFVGFRCVSR